MSQALKTYSKGAPFYNVWIILAGFKHSHYFFVLDVLSAELAIDSCVPPTSEYRSI